MDTQKLFNWLGLPPGPWPPDDRTLLGLGAGPIDPFAAEKRALDLMERLRPHQLVNPDLVTEGMNRLAQALVAVSAMPTAPPPPKKPPAPKPAPKPAPAKADLPKAPPGGIIPRPGQPAPPKPAFESVDFALPTAGAEPPPGVMDAEVVEAEVVEAEVVEAEVVEAEVVAAPARRPPRRRKLPANLPPVSFTLPPPAEFVPPADRRDAYRELAGLRQLRRAWRRLRASVADPGEPLLGPAEVCAYLEGVLDVRAALARKELTEDALGPAGKTVRALVRRPNALATYRVLNPIQRRNLAGDWAAGWAAIEARSGAVRRHLKATRPPKQNAVVTGAARWLAGNPECLMIVASVLALAVAAAR